MAFLKTVLLILSEQKVMQNAFIFCRIRIVPIAASTKRQAMLWMLISSKMNYQKWYSGVLLKAPSGPFVKKVLLKCGLKIFNGWKKKDQKQNMNYLSDIFQPMYHFIPSLSSFYL